MKNLGKFTIKHIDGVTNIRVQLKLYPDNTIRGEYKYDKMSWGCNFDYKDAIARGFIKQDN